MEGRSRHIIPQNRVYHAMRSYILKRLSCSCCWETSWVFPSPKNQRKCYLEFISMMSATLSIRSSEAVGDQCSGNTTRGFGNGWMRTPPVACQCYGLHSRGLNDFLRMASNTSSGNLQGAKVQHPGYGFQSLRNNLNHPLSLSRQSLNSHPNFSSLSTEANGSWTHVDEYGRHQYTSFSCTLYHKY